MKFLYKNKYHNLRKNTKKKGISYMDIYQVTHCRNLELLNLIAKENHKKDCYVLMAFIFIIGNTKRETK